MAEVIENMETVLFSISKNGVTYRIRHYINDQIGVERFNDTNNKWYVCSWVMIK